MLIADYSKTLPNDFRLYWMADLHIGMAGVKEKLIKDLFARIKRDDNARIALGGDLIEAAPVGHPYFDIDVHGGDYAVTSKQVDRVCELLDGLQDKILFNLVGNHELRIKNIMDVGAAINQRLGIDVPCGNVDIVCTLTEKKHDDYPAIKFYAHHGAGSVNSQAGDLDQIYRNDARRVKRKLRFKRADCILMGMAHIHKIRICKPVKQMMIIGDKDKSVKQEYPEAIFTSDGAIEENSRWYFSTGAFFGSQVEGIDTYASKYMYDPLQLGCVKIYVEDAKVKNVEPVIMGN